MLDMKEVKEALAALNMVLENEELKKVAGIAFGPKGAIRRMMTGFLELLSDDDFMKATVEVHKKFVDQHLSAGFSREEAMGLLYINKLGLREFTDRVNKRGK